MEKHIAGKNDSREENLLMMREEKYYFEKTYEIAEENAAMGEDPFACLLVDGNGRILERDASQGQAVDPSAHDVMSLLRKCWKKYDPKFLSECTVYCLCEPCVMCMGAMFWFGVHRVVFEVSEKELGEMLPGGLEISSTEFVRRAPVPMESLGPFEGLTESRKLVKKWADKILGK